MGLFDGTPLERPVLCDRCQRNIKECQCPPVAATEPEVAPEKQRLSIRVEKRKNGRSVTTVTGFTGSESQISSLFVELKNHLGAGGTCDANSIEVQGQHRDKVQSFLKAKSYKLRQG